MGIADTAMAEMKLLVGVGYLQECCTQLRLNTDTAFSETWYPPPYSHGTGNGG